MKTVFDIDKAFQLVGSDDHYQRCLVALLCLNSFSSSISAMGPTYIFTEPNLYCNGKPCGFNECTQPVTSDSSFKYKNVITDFDLWCDRKQFINLSLIALFFGSLLAGVIISHIGDQLGRKKAFIIAQSLTVIGQLMSVFSFNIMSYVFGSFLAGFSIGTYLLTFTLLNEQCGQKTRQKYTVLTFISWAIAEILASVIFYSFNNWRLAYGLFSTLPAILVLIFSFKLIESPKFHYSRGDLHQLIISLNSIAQINEKPELGRDWRDQIITGQENMNRGNISNLIKIKSLRIPSLGFILLSFGSHLIYYICPYSLSKVSVGDDIYIFQMYVGLAGLLSFICAHQGISRIRRKLGMLVSYGACLIFCCLFTIGGQTLFVFLATLVRFFNSFAFAIQAVYSQEFYPTVIRSTGSGTTFTVGVTGSIVAPLLTSYLEKNNINPFPIIGFLGLIGVIGSFLIPETLGQPMLDQIDQHKKNQMLTLEDIELEQKSQ